MYVDSNTKLTDSLERTLIEREANALRSETIAASVRKLGAALRRLPGAVAGAMARMRRDARDAKVEYVAG